MAQSNPSEADDGSKTPNEHSSCGTSLLGARELLASSSSTDCRSNCQVNTSQPDDLQTSVDASSAVTKCESQPTSAPAAAESGTTSGGKRLDSFPRLRIKITQATREGCSSEGTTVASLGEEQEVWWISKSTECPETDGGDAVKEKQ